MRLTKKEDKDDDGEHVGSKGEEGGGGIRGISTKGLPLESPSSCEQPPFVRTLKYLHSQLVHHFFPDHCCPRSGVIWSLQREKQVAMLGNKAEQGWARLGN